MTVHRVTTKKDFQDLLRSRVSGGFDVHLVGEFTDLRIQTHFADTIRIFAYEATVKTAWLHCSNVAWFGGRIEAMKGAAGNAYEGYGLWIRNARNVSVDDVRVTNCNRGIAMDSAANVCVSSSWISVRQDGIIANKVDGLRIIRNSFTDFRMMVGDHSDAIQLRNGIRNCHISDNFISGVQQGIGQMDGPTDAPLDGVMVIRNNVNVFGAHSITFDRCSRLVVLNNTVKQTTGLRTVLRLPPDAISVGNTVIT